MNLKRVDRLHAEARLQVRRRRRRKKVPLADTPGSTMTRLCTNLPRTAFSLDLVGRLYRFRWQIERCFTAWTSYANLHQFGTAHVRSAEGLIGASLCATLLLGVGLRGTLRRGLAYLLANARRANPDRDRRTGRVRTGLGLAEAA